MKERIDKFMKAVREKYPSNCTKWENLHKELRDLCEEDDRKELTKQWCEFHLERKLAKWDDDFMELVINGAKVNEVSGAHYTQSAEVKRYLDAMKQRQMAESALNALRFHGVENPERLMK